MVALAKEGRSSLSCLRGLFRCRRIAMEQAGRERVSVPLLRVNVASPSPATSAPVGEAQPCASLSNGSARPALPMFSAMMTLSPAWVRRMRQQAVSPQPRISLFPRGLRVLVAQKHGVPAVVDNGGRSLLLLCHGWNAFFRWVPVLDRTRSYISGAAMMFWPPAVLNHLLLATTPCAPQAPLNATCPQYRRRYRCRQR